MTDEQEDALAAIVTAQRRLAEATSEAALTREARNAAVVRALQSGATAYRIAQVLGLSQTAVAKIRSKG